MWSKNHATTRLVPLSRLVSCPARPCVELAGSAIGPCHDDVIKWKHFPRYWPFVWGIHRSPVKRSFDVFFHLRLNKQLNKQSWSWWFETLSCSLRRHCNVYYVEHRLVIIALTISPDWGQQGIILCINPANERRRYIVTSFIVRWARAHNELHWTQETWRTARHYSGWPSCHLCDRPYQRNRQ